MSRELRNYKRRRKRYKSHIDKASQQPGALTGPGGMKNIGSHMDNIVRAIIERPRLPNSARRYWRYYTERSYPIIISGGERLSLGGGTTTMGLLPRVGRLQDSCLSFMSRLLLNSRASHLHIIKGGSYNMNLNPMVVTGYRRNNLSLTIRVLAYVGYPDDLTVVRVSNLQDDRGGEGLRGVTLTARSVAGQIDTYIVNESKPRVIYRKVDYEFFSMRVRDGILGVLCATGHYPNIRYGAINQEQFASIQQFLAHYRIAKNAGESMLAGIAAEKLIGIW